MKGQAMNEAKMELKTFELQKGIYQIEKGKKAIVLPAKSLTEAIKKASRYLGLKLYQKACNEA
jgi:hypothetical protein